MSEETLWEIPEASREGHSQLAVRGDALNDLADISKSRRSVNPPNYYLVKTFVNRIQLKYLKWI